MYSVINKRTIFMKYCYFRASYVKMNACECKDVCKYATKCSLTKKPKKFIDCSCMHNCSATLNHLDYTSHFHKSDT
jgi:hypothetical protein